MIEASHPTDDVRDFALVHRLRSHGRFALMYRDVGIRLGPGGLDWTSAGEARHAAYADIVEIRLQTGTVGRGGSFGTCTIAFDNGEALNIFGVTRFGNPDQEKGAIYGDFVRDLHRRLGPADRERIRFCAGGSPGFRTFGKVAMTIGVAFFIAMPVVLLAVTGDMRALAVLFGGAIFMTPFLKTFRRNAPTAYTPEHIPEELIP